MEVLEFATKDDNIAKNILHQIFDIVKCKHGAEPVNKIDYVIMLTDQIPRIHLQNYEGYWGDVLLR